MRILYKKILLMQKSLPHYFDSFIEVLLSFLFILFSKNNNNNKFKKVLELYSRIYSSFKLF